MCSLKPCLKEISIWAAEGFTIRTIIAEMPLRGVFTNRCCRPVSDKFSIRLGNANMTFLLRGSDEPKQPGVCLVKAMGCEQALSTGFKGSMIGKIAVRRSVADLQKSLAYIKVVLEHQK